MMRHITVRELAKILVASFRELQKNGPLRLAGATAFFTTFALPPILIILVVIIGIVFRIDNLKDKFFVQIAEVIGRQSASQVKLTFWGFTSLAKNWWMALGGFVFLIFVATTLFKVIRDSLNQLWNVKISTKKQFRIKAEKRAASLIIILLAGVLFIGTLVADGLEHFIFQYTNELPSRTGTVLNSFITQTISGVLIATWFAILFKVLPDAKVSWRVAIAGGAFTGILFTAGKIVIRFMLSIGNLTNIFGASSSLVLILLFVFYSSFILYYGACFTKVLATHIKEPITPTPNSTRYKVVEIDSE